jgi:hypothetical protein
MSKKSFDEIEQAIRHAAEAHEPAFDELSWKKMEALLDKDKDRKRPFIFWLWLLPLLIGTAVAGYFIFDNTGKEHTNQQIAAQKNDKPVGEKGNNNPASAQNAKVNSLSTNNDPGITAKNTSNNNTGHIKLYVPVTAVNGKAKPASAKANLLAADDQVNSKKKLKDKVDGKTSVTIKPAMLSEDEESNESVLTKKGSGQVTPTAKESEKMEEVIVIKVDAGKTSEKEIEKMVDSVVEKINSDKKKRKISGLYIVAVAGAEANGVKLFSADKITGRYGLGIGYQLNKNLSVQTGFYVSNKKYIATGGDYKTKPGSYWNVVDIKSIEANCKVYEIPVSVIYNFTPGKMLGVFASAGLSSYIMEREDYRYFYERYGTPHQADQTYTGNKHLFSVLRLSAGIEKKISNGFSIIVSPGIAVPLTGVGDGEVKLYSADITIGLRFTPFHKK